MSFAQPFSNYEILDRIGSGAMGTVFKARQKHMNRIVALKVLKPSLARDTRYVERLRREAQIVGQLNHPNIVTGYDLGAEGGYHFFVMEFVEGRSLKELLEEWGAFTEDRVLDVAIQVTRALEHALEVGIIHRDIKPANILIDERNRVKLTDMGLAKVATDLTLTREGATVGTPQYISPEQAKNPRDVDVRSDLYSLGATLFHMATGQAPFRAESIGELIAKVLHERAPSAIRLNPALTDGLSLVIRKLLAKDPDLRYQTPSDLLKDLERVQRSESPRVDPKELERDAMRARRRSFPVIGSPSAWSLIAGIAIGAVGLWAFERFGDDEPGAKAVEFDYPSGATLGEQLGRARAALALARERDPRSDASAAWNAERLRLVSSIEQVARERLRALSGEESSRVLTVIRRFDGPSADAVADRLLGGVFGPPIALEPTVLGDDDLGQRLREPIDRFRDRVREIFEVERVAFGQRLERYLVDVERAVEELASDGRFDVGADLVARAIDDFLQQEFAGLDIERAQLPTVIQSDLIERARIFESRLEGRIAESRDLAVDRLRESAERVSDAFHDVLQDVSIGRLRPEDGRARLEALQRELTRFHPPASALTAAGREVWSDAVQAYRSALAELQSEADTQRLDRLGALRELAYELIPSLGPGAVADWLATTASPVPSELAVDIRVFRAAAEVVAAVRRIAKPYEPVGTEVVGDEGLRVVELTGRGPVVVEPLGRDRPYTATPFAELQSNLPEVEFSSPEARSLGVAFWLYVDGRRDDAIERLGGLDAETAVTISTRIEPRLLALGSSSSADSARSERLASLLLAMAEGDLETVAAVRAELGEPQNEREQRVLGQADLWQQTETRLRARTARLRNELPAEVRRVEGLGLIAEIDPTSLGGRGFERSGDVLRRVGGLEQSFVESRRNALVVPGPRLEAGESIVGAFRFSLSELHGQSSLLIEFGRTAFVIGCFGSDWEIVAAEVREQEVEDPDVIRQRLQIALLAALEVQGPRVVQDAWHRVEIVRGASEVILTIDGVAVAKAASQGSVDEALPLRLTAFGEFALDRFRYLLPTPG